MKLYYHPLSPPCWAVMLLGRQLKLKIDLHEIDVLGGAQLKEDFLAINPEHTVPTFVDDDGFTLGESRTILRYLVDRYGKQPEDPLYPRSDAQRRALIEQRLDYDLGTLYARFLAYCEPMWYLKQQPSEKARKDVREALGVLEKRLGGGAKFVDGGDQLTIADIAVVTTVSALDSSYFKLDGFPGVEVWYEKCRGLLEGYDEIVASAFEPTRKHIVKSEE